VQSIPARLGIASLVSQSRPAVGPSLRLRGFPQANVTGPGLLSPVHPLVELGSPSESLAVEPSRRTGLATECPGAGKPLSSPERPLSWAFTPHSTCGIEGPLNAGVAFPLRSALRVALPSRRFAPLEASPAIFRAGSAFGIPLRSFLLPRGFRVVSARKHPPTVSPDVVPLRQSGGPARRAAVSGLQPSQESSGVRMRYERAVRRVLPWVSPP